LQRFAAPNLHAPEDGARFASANR